MHPEISRALMDARVVEIQRSRTAVRRDRPARHTAQRLRRRSGWMLVELGLRLASPTSG